MANPFNITRRVALKSLALSAAVVGSRCVVVPAVAQEMPVMTPEELVKHHRDALINAMDALVSDGESRWMVCIFGKNGHEPSMMQLCRSDARAGRLHWDELDL